jgi:hypothetical protein
LRNAQLWIFCARAAKGLRGRGWIVEDPDKGQFFGEMGAPSIRAAKPWYE